MIWCKGASGMGGPPIWPRVWPNLARDVRLRGRLHHDHAIRACDLQRQPFGGGSGLHPNGEDRSQRRQAASAKLRGQVAQKLGCQVQHPDRLQMAGHDKTVDAFGLCRLGQIIMDAVRVKGQGTLAKQQDRIRRDLPLCGIGPVFGQRFR